MNQTLRSRARAYSPAELREVLSSGLMSFPLTDFDKAGDFHEAGYRDRLEWLMPYGATVLFAAGGTGEVFSMTPAEQAGGAAPAPAPSAWKAVREGLVANLTNPHPLVFMLAFLPQFVDPSRGSVTAQLLLLGATQKATGFAVLGATALASGAVGGWLARRPGLVVWQERFAGAVMVALGLRLLVSGARAGR